MVAVARPLPELDNGRCDGIDLPARGDVIWIGREERLRFRQISLQFRCVRKHRALSRGKGTGPRALRALKVVGSAFVGWKKTCQSAQPDLPAEHRPIERQRNMRLRCYLLCLWAFCLDRKMPAAPIDIFQDQHAGIRPAIFVAGRKRHRMWFAYAGRQCLIQPDCKGLLWSSGECLQVHVRKWRLQGWNSTQLVFQACGFGCHDRHLSSGDADWMTDGMSLGRQSDRP